VAIMMKQNTSNYKKCGHCGKSKSIADFIVGRNIKLQITYSQYCKPCRILLEKAKKTKYPISKTQQDE
jgi:hypothetical protein